MKVRKNISIEESLYNKVEEKIKPLGLSLSAYLTLLINTDITGTQTNIPAPQPQEDKVINELSPEQIAARKEGLNGLSMFARKTAGEE